MLLNNDSIVVLPVAAGIGSTACKFAEKVWNAQDAGAQAVRAFLAIGRLTCLLLQFLCSCFSVLFTECLCFYVSLNCR